MNNELKHVGVLGMKWGVRRSRNSSGSGLGSGRRAKQKATIESFRKSKADAKAVKEKEKNRVKNMSDQELRQKLNRMQMEKQYKQLSKENVSKGRECTRNIIKGVLGVTAATTTALTLYSNAEKIGSIMSKIKK